MVIWTIHMYNVTVIDTKCKSGGWPYEQEMDEEVAEALEDCPPLEVVTRRGMVVQVDPGFLQLTPHLLSALETKT